MRAESIAAMAQVEGVVIVDPRLIEELQEQRGQALFGFARRLGLTDEQAADAVQETLLRLWRESHRGRPIEDRPAWAFRTIYRIAMDEHRLRRRLAGLRDRLQREDGRPSSDSEATDRDDSLTVWAQVDRLPARQRQVLYLRYRAELSFDDVAAVLAISPGAARTLASRALERVRRELADPGAG